MATPTKKPIQRAASRPKAARKQPARPRHFAKWRVIWLSVAAFFLLFGLGLVAFVAIKPFRERVDDLYYSIYARYFIDPTLSNISIRHRNVPYCGTVSRFQEFDVYEPKWGEKPTAAVIYVHGGGWAVGDKINNNVAVYGTDLVRNGIAVVSINYRLAPAYQYPTQNRDVACAVDYLETHAADYNIDPGRIGLWGDSAGGQLVAMTALDVQSKRSHTIKAVAEFYGTADLWAQITRRTPAGKSNPDKRAIIYLGSSSNKMLADSASPVYANASGAPPFLLFHGTNDQVVHYAQSVNFANHLQAADVDVQLVPVQNANHNFSAVSQPTAEQISRQMTQFFRDKLR